MPPVRVPKRNIFLRKFAKWSRKYLDYYNNYSYNFRKNGEETLLSNLSKFDFGMVFDVGANIGNWAGTAKKYFPHAEIHCFELSRATFENLSKNLVDQTFKLNNVGLSNCAETITYKDYGMNSGVNTIVLSVEFHDRRKTPNICTAEVITGDSYCDDKQIQNIDFLKIDVEGGEHLVLEGFSRALSDRKIRLIQFEYGYANGDAKFLMKDFYEFFGKYGYIVGVVRKRGVEFRNWNYELNDFTSGPNYVAVKADDKEMISAVSC